VGRKRLPVNLAAIDANLLVALNALLSEQNVSRAAQSVGLAQSSMSHTLARLRSHFADPLLVPSGRRLVLTERARSLVEPVRLAIAHLDRVFTPQVAFDPSTSEREFRLVATDNIELYLLPRLMRLVAREAPRITLHVHHLPVDWMKGLTSGAADLKLGRKYPLPPAFQSEDLFEERFTCVVRRNHPLRSSRPTLAQFAALNFLDVVPSSSAGMDVRGFVDDVLAQQGLERRVALKVSHFLVAPHVVASSDLALIASERVIAPFVKPLGLRALRIPLTVAGYRLTQVWLTKSDDDAGHRWLRRAIARAARGRMEG
jgi:DNA-binding transcriptional LysR family regulator